MGLAYVCHYYKSRPLESSVLLANWNEETVNTEQLRCWLFFSSASFTLCLQLEEMRQLSARNVDVSDRAQAELKNARKRVEELNSEINRLISQVCLPSSVQL